MLESFFTRVKKIQREDGFLMYVLTILAFDRSFLCNELKEGVQRRKEEKGTPRKLSILGGDQSIRGTVKG